MNLGLTPDEIVLRREGLGGSDAADIMAGNWTDLWNVKTGRMEEPALYDKLVAEGDYFKLKHLTPERLDLARLIGHATEDLNHFWYEQKTGRTVERRRERVVSKTHPFMCANLDGVTTTSRGYPAYWDAKHMARLDEAAVLRLTPQGVHCASILGLDWWVLSVFIGNSKWELVEQEVDPLYQANLIAREREFWGYVERDEEPPEPERVLAPKPQPKLRTIIVPTDSPAVVEALQRENNWLSEAQDEIKVFASTLPAYTLNNIARDKLKKLIPPDVGEICWGRFKYKVDRAGKQHFSMAKSKGDDDEHHG